MWKSDFHKPLKEKYNDLMRREPYSLGSFVHVIKRGNRGLAITRDERDRQRFLLSLTHLNDAHTVDNWYRDLDHRTLLSAFERPKSWHKQKKLTEIVCFCLVGNHFHLLLKEINESGISRFMQKLGTSLAKTYNEKYKETGTLFQGAYKSRTINDDVYFRYLSAYIQVKNCFETYPKRKLDYAANFDKMFEWAMRCPYSSLGDFMNVLKRSITDQQFLSEIFTSEEYGVFCRDFISGRATYELSLDSVE